METITILEVSLPSWQRLIVEQEMANSGRSVVGKKARSPNAKAVIEPEQV